MKKYISLLVSGAFIASCGCTQVEEEVYSHKTGLPEGPDGSYGSDVLGIPTYNYIKAEADLISGEINKTEYCEIEGELFPTNFATEQECSEAKFTGLFSGVMDDDTELNNYLLSIVDQQKDLESVGLAFDELIVEVDYSGYMADVQLTENKVKTGGHKITMTMIFENGVHQYRSGLINIFGSEFGTEYSLDVDIIKPEELVLTRYFESHSLIYNMHEVNNEWLIESKN